MDERVDSFLTDIAVINGGNTRERLDIFVVNSQKLAEGIKKTSGVDVEYVPSMADIENYLAANARTGDLVMTIGAGDVYKVGEALVADLQRSNENV